jgi:hypothetical protein
VGVVQHLAQHSQRPGTGNTTLTRPYIDVVETEGVHNPEDVTVLEPQAYLAKPPV